jgi:type I restriction enzyme S subunit
MSARTTLGEILPLSYGKARSASYGEVRQETPVYGSSGNIGTFDRALTTGPALIVGRKGSAGAIFYAPEPCWPIDTVYFTEGNERTNLPYFRYLLESLSLGKLDRSTAIPSLSRDDYNSIQIDVPSPDEQHRIVAEIEERLSRLEAGVAALKRVQANLKRYRAAALRSVFTGGSAGNDLPSGWRWTTLGEQFHIGVGATPSRKEPAYWGGSIPWVSSGEVQFCRICETSEHITDQGLSNSSTRINPRGSVLLAMIGQGRTRGQAAILEIEAANNQNCAAIWVGESETPPEFVYYWLMSEYEATRQVGSGNNQQALNKSLVQALPIPWPPIAEQHKIVAKIERRLSVVEETETQVHADLARAERLRQAALARAFAPDDRSR